MNLTSHQRGRLLEIDVAMILGKVQKIRPYMRFEDRTKNVGRDADFTCKDNGLEVKNLANHYAKTRTMVRRNYLARVLGYKTKLLIAPVTIYTPRGLTDVIKFDAICDIPEQVGFDTTSHLQPIINFLLHLPTSLFFNSAILKLNRGLLLFYRLLEGLVWRCTHAMKIAWCHLRRGKPPPNPAYRV